MFLTQVELDSYLRCHRNIRGLEEFLNKANRSLLRYLVSINDIIGFIRLIFYFLLGSFFFLVLSFFLVLKKKSEKPLLQTFLPRYKFMHLDRVIYPFKNIMLILH